MVSGGGGPKIISHAPLPLTRGNIRVTAARATGTNPCGELFSHSPFFYSGHLPDGLLSRSASPMDFHALTDQLKARFEENARNVSGSHWVYEVMTDNQRSQVVHLLYKQQRENGRDADRIVADSPIGPLPRRYDLEKLLRRNAELDVGAICIEDFRNEEGDQVTYLTLRASHLLSTLDFEEVWEMIEKVARMADVIERDVYASDLH
jgi:hypothetical protein